MFFKLLDKLIYHVTAFCFLAASSIAFIQVISRYVFNSSLSWAEEALRYLFIWLFFLASAAAFKDKMHVGLDIIVDSFKPKLRNVIHHAVDLLLIVFLSFLVFYGYLFSYENMAQLSTALEIPIGLVNAAIPVGSALMIFYLVRNIYLRITVKESE